MIRKMLMADVVQVVIVGILSHPTVEVCPRQDILVWYVRLKLGMQFRGEAYHCILLVLDGLDSDFSEEVVMEHVCREV